MSKFFEGTLCGFLNGFFGSGGGVIAVRILASMGLGGGFILVVWLTLFENVGQKAAQGINVLFFLPIAFIALLLHLKNHLVN